MKFLVRDLDARVLRQIRKEARSARLSVAEYMRSILCAHYDLDCTPSRHKPRKEDGARTKVLRMQPELWQAVKDDSAESGVSMQICVRAALEAHYREEAA